MCGCDGGGGEGWGEGWIGDVRGGCWGGGDVELGSCGWVEMVMRALLAVEVEEGGSWCGVD